MRRVHGIALAFLNPNQYFFVKTLRTHSIRSKWQALTLFVTPLDSESVARANSKYECPMSGQFLRDTNNRIGVTTTAAPTAATTTTTKCTYILGAPQI